MPETPPLEATGLDRVERYLDDIFAPEFRGCDDACFAGGLLSLDASRTGRRVSVSGVGFTAESARRSCLGEAAEYLSFLRRRDDPLVVEESGATDGFVVCRDAVTDEPVPVPSALVLRNPELPDARRRTTSNGLGAGESIEQALLHGLLELIERREVTGWWSLQEPRPGIDAVSVRNALPEVKVSPDAVTARPWFLDLTGTTPVSVVGAFSEHPETREVACGFKAAPSRQAAIRGAFLELRQHQLSQHIARVRGQARSALNVADFPCLLPDGVGSNAGLAASADSFAGLSRLLHAQGVRVLWIDLTRQDVGVPVGRVLLDQLQGPLRNGMIDTDGVEREKPAGSGGRRASLPDLY